MRIRYRTNSYANFSTASCRPTIEKLPLEPAPETTGDENAHGSDRTGRTNSNWERVHCVTAQAYGPRVTKCIPRSQVPDDGDGE